MPEPMHTYAVRWGWGFFSATGITGNGAAACEVSQAAGPEVIAIVRSASAPGRIDLTPSSGGKLGGEPGQTGLLPVRSLLLDDALGGGAVQDRNGSLIGGPGGSAGLGFTNRLDGRAHLAANGDVTQPGLLVGDDALGGGLVMRHGSLRWDCDTRMSLRG